MQIQIDIPEDLVDFIEKKAKQATIPAIFYGQMKFVDFIRDMKENEEWVSEPEKPLEIEEEDKKRFELREQRRDEREEREIKMFTVAIEAVQAFSEAMKAQTDLASSTARAFDRIMDIPKEEN